jgi:hypothetical protein
VMKQYRLPLRPPMLPKLAATIQNGQSPRPPQRRGPKEKSCVVTMAVSAPCAECGRYGEPCHVPLTARGFWCGEHCPCCHQAGAITATAAPEVTR